MASFGALDHNQRLIKLKADIQRLEGEWKEKSADARLGIQEEIRRLRQRHADIETKLHGLKTASAAAWSEAKDGMANACNELEAAFQKARAAFNRQR